MGGATARVAPDATAFGDRGAPFMLSFDAQTRDPSNYATVREWARTTSEAARSLNGARGAYLNFSGDEATDTRVLDQQYGQNMSRLRAIKKQYDPHNLFCVNNNITPAA